MAQKNDQPPASPTLIPALPSPIPPTTSSAATSEELSFFDRAKKAISNKNTFNEFLKLCNLFSQDLVDRTVLVHRARSFIGTNPELMKWFQDFIGYDEKDVIVDNKARIPGGRVSLSNCRGLGPSYRLLPKRVRYLFFLLCSIVAFVAIVRGGKVWLCPSHRIFSHFSRRCLELDQRTSHSLDYDFFGTLFEHTIAIFDNIYLPRAAGPFCFIATFIIASLAAGSANQSFLTLARLPSPCHPRLVLRQAPPATRVKPLKTLKPPKTPKTPQPLQRLQRLQTQPNHRLPRKGRLLSHRAAPRRLASSPLAHLHALGEIFRLLRALR